MPTRRLPNTITSVIRTLNTARDAWKEFPADRLITAAHWAKLDDSVADSFLNRFLKEAGDVPQALAAQAPLTDAFSQSIAKLTLYVSHFHQVFDLAVARGVYAPGSRAHYDRDITATALPDLSGINAVIEAGAAIIRGEATRKTAEAAAHIPMTMPSAAEVAAVHADAVAKRKAAEAAKANTDKQQNELGALYPDAQKLAVSIINTVEFQLSQREDLDDAGCRRIARQWGVVYLNDDGTASNDDPTPAPTPVPTPPPNGGKSA